MNKPTVEDAYDELLRIAYKAGYDFVDVHGLVREAVSKATPQEPYYFIDKRGNVSPDLRCCPTCHATHTVDNEEYDYQYTYCSECGQRFVKYVK